MAAASLCSFCPFSFFTAVLLGFTSNGCVPDFLKEKTLQEEQITQRKTCNNVTLSTIS